jgi:hypothetical protein
MDLTVAPDTSLDANSNPELAVLMRTGEWTTLQVRDSAEKKLIQSIMLPSQPL